MSGFSSLVVSTLYVCMVMWSKGSKCTSGEVCFCHCCYWDAGIEILCSIFPPLPTAVAVLFFLKKKKKSQKRNILYSINWYCKSIQSRFLLFLSLWLVNSEKEVQFECSDDGEDLYRQIFFSSCEAFTLRNQTVAFSFVNILWELQDFQVQPCEF